MYGEKALLQLHKNATSNIEQVLETAHRNAAAIRPPTTHCENYQNWTNQTFRTSTGWRSRDKLISDVLQWTPSHGRAKVGRPARTNIQQLCADTGCRPEDLPEAMDDREGWRKRVRYISADSVTWWWWWWWYMHVGVFVCLCVINEFVK